MPVKAGKGSVLSAFMLEEKRTLLSSKFFQISEKIGYKFIAKSKTSIIVNRRAIIFQNYLKNTIMRMKYR